MFFKSWTRRSDASIEEQKRREEEEDAARLERLRRAAEAQSLNEEVTKRLKRYSHDESPSSTPPKIDRRHSGLSSKEVNKINKHISRREEERRQPSQRVTPRRDLVQRDEEDEDVEPAETTSGGGSGNASDDETAVVLTPPTGLTPDKQRSAGGSRRASKENMTSAEASAASSKGETPERQRRNRLLSSSRERLAELRREAEQKKQDAGLVKAKDEEAEERKKQTARAVGAARASAKLAGGVFYTYQENGEILGKMKEYRNERDALQIECNQLRQEKEALQVRLSSLSLSRLIAGTIPLFSSFLTTHAPPSLLSLSQEKHAKIEAYFATLAATYEVGKEGSPSLRSSGTEHRTPPGARLPSSVVGVAAASNGGLASFLKDSWKGATASPPPNRNSPSPFGRRQRLSGGPRGLIIGVTSALNAMGLKVPTMKEDSTHKGTDFAGLSGVEVKLVRPPSA